MQHETGNETADFLLNQLQLLARVGSPQQRAEAPKWASLVRENAVQHEEQKPSPEFGEPEQ